MVTATLGREVLTIRNKDGVKMLLQCPRCRFYCSVCNLNTGCCPDREKRGG